MTVMDRPSAILFKCVIFQEPSRPSKVQPEEGDGSESIFLATCPWGQGAFSAKEGTRTIQMRQAKNMSLQKSKGTRQFEAISRKCAVALLEQ